MDAGFIIMNTGLLAVAFYITNIKNVPCPKGGKRDGERR